jgi:hypothetical protein
VADWPVGAGGLRRDRPLLAERRAGIGKGLAIATRVSADLTEAAGCESASPNEVWSPLSVHFKEKVERLLVFCWDSKFEFVIHVWLFDLLCLHESFIWGCEDQC